MQRRKNPRKPVALTSEILFEDKEVPCRILNLSTSSAKLKITQERVNKLPCRAVLDITPFDRFTVTDVWYNVEHLGAKSHDAPDKWRKSLLSWRFNER